MRRPFKDPETSGVSRFPRSLIEGLTTAQYGGVYDASWRQAAVGYRYDPTRPPQAPMPLGIALTRYSNNSTNWYEYMFRPAQVLNANIQASGGGEKVQYLIGAGLYDEKGIVKGSDFSRFNCYQSYC